MTVGRCHTVGVVNERQVITEGLAAFASSFCETGLTDDEVKAGIERQCLALHLDAEDVLTLLREAAEALRHLPQPIYESAEDTERARPIRVMLGVTSAEDQLAATLRAGELLQQMADEIEERLV